MADCCNVEPDSSMDVGLPRSSGDGGRHTALNFDWLHSVTFLDGRNTRIPWRPFLFSTSCKVLRNFLALAAVPYFANKNSSGIF
eukprot:scaffold10474_cov122-Isochrysis_galbana.AAC.8